MNKPTGSQERARAYADFVQFRLGKGLESREYLEYMLMYLQDYVAQLQSSLRVRNN